MLFHRRAFLHFAAAGAALTAPNAASALDYPTRPVHMIVGAAGGPTDVVARLIAQWLSELSAISSAWRTAPVPAARSPPRR